MKIPKWCPQRHNGFSLVVPKLFAVNADSKIVCPTADAKMLGLHYSTYANSAYTVENTRIGACDSAKLTPACHASFTACDANHDTVKVGLGNVENNCICCPKP